MSFLKLSCSGSKPLIDVYAQPRNDKMVTIMWLFSEIKIIQMLDFLFDYIFVKFGGRVCNQTIDILLVL